MASRHDLRLGFAKVMRNTGTRAAGFLRRIGGSDAALAAVVVAVVALMIVPLPTTVLDVLLATNLALSISILLVSLYVPDALHIASFPTLLLVTTLSRVGLNVAATRLILLHANAGEVIHAFGSVVVGSNYVVGGVVFSVLTLVQYLVIAKGSERVAEVGARFTLDALPGKQIGIDAELRIGAIDADQARQKRRQLSRESQFYGAMDGAMKFVKGDVIASIFIALVNILGGLAIGVGQRDMAVGDALKRYGLLTIGNGLVSLIPALILATAAGVLVTRVSSEEPNQSLGAALGAELLGEPRALLIASLFVVGLGFVPGLPLVPFGAIGILLFLASRARASHLGTRSQPTSPKPVVHPERAGDVLRFVPVVVPWSLQWGPREQPVGVRHKEESPEEVLRDATDQLREQLFMELGVPLPPCRVEANAELPAGSLRLVIHELACSNLALPGWADSKTNAQTLIDSLKSALRGRSAEFLGMSETQALLSELERFAPQTVRQVVPKPITLGMLSEILRRLVEEGLSIRDLSAILEALSQASAHEHDPLALAEHVRSQLRRSTTQQLTAGESKLGVILLDPSVEEVVRASITRTASGAFLALAPSASQDIVQAIRRAMGLASEKRTSVPVLLASPDTRRHFRKLIETDLPDLRVISPAELLPEIALETLATVTVANL